MKLSKILPAKHGQALMEYLVLTCLISVAAISVVTIVSQNIRSRFATISATLRGEKEVKKDLKQVEEADFKLRGFDDFEESGKKRD